jgi:hypothetical protein
MGEMRSTYNILVGIPEGKRLLGRPRCRREDNITVYLRKIPWRCEGVDCVLLAEVRDQWRTLGKTIMNLIVLHKGWGIL